MTNEERVANADRVLEEWEILGCKGADLIEEYPYLRDLLPSRRRREMCKIAVDRWKMEATIRSLGGSPAEWGLE